MKAFGYIKAFDRVWHAVLLHKLKFYGISGQIFGLIYSSQKYPVNARLPRASILGPTLFLLYINDHPDHIICDIDIYADDTTLCSKCDQAFDCGNNLNWLLNLNLIFKTLETGVRSGLLISILGRKTQLVSFYQSNNSGSINVKMDGPVPEEKPSFKILE